MSELGPGMPQPPTPPAAPHRSYTIRKRNTNGVPRPFDINGEQFTAYPERVPAMVAMDLPGIRIHQDSEPMWELFRAMLPNKDDYARFRAILRDPELEFDAERDLKPLLEDLLGDAAEVPTPPPNS